MASAAAARANVAVALIDLQLERSTLFRVICCLEQTGFYLCVAGTLGGDTGTTSLAWVCAGKFTVSGFSVHVRPRASVSRCCGRGWRTTRAERGVPLGIGPSVQVLAPFVDFGACFHCLERSRSRWSAESSPAFVGGTKSLKAALVFVYFWHQRQNYSIRPAPPLSLCQVTASPYESDEFWLPKVSLLLSFVLRSTSD